MPGIRAWVASGRDLSQAAEVMRPAFRMAGALLRIGQAYVGQAQAAFRPAARSGQSTKLDPGGTTSLPCQAVHWLHLAEGAAGRSPRCRGPGVEMPKPTGGTMRPTMAAFLVEA